MKTLLLTSILLTGLFSNSGETTVYHCNSGTATSYHLKKDCRGLNACKHEVETLTVAEAKEQGLKLCGWED